MNRIETIFPSWEINLESHAAKIRTAVKWEQHDSHRIEALFNRSGKPYMYNKERGARAEFPQDEPEGLTDMWKAVEGIVGHRFGVCFLSVYLNQMATVGWHQDNSPSIDWSAPVCVLSIGQRRPIEFREIGTDGPIESIMCESGMITIMNAGCNDTHEHRIPEVRYPCSERMSLVFRAIRRS